MSKRKLDIESLWMDPNGTYGFDIEESQESDSDDVWGERLNNLIREELQDLWEWQRDFNNRQYNINDEIGWINSSAQEKWTDINTFRGLRGQFAYEL